MLDLLELLDLINFVGDASDGTRRRDVNECGEAWPKRGLLDNTGDRLPSVMSKV